MKVSEPEANTYSWRQAQKNACRQVTIGFGFTPYWLGIQSGARSFSQSQSVAMQNQSNSEITFDAQLKTALFLLLYILPVL